VCEIVKHANTHVIRFHVIRLHTPSDFTHPTISHTLRFHTPYVIRVDTPCNTYGVCNRVTHAHTRSLSLSDTHVLHQRLIGNGIIEILLHTLTLSITHTHTHIHYCSIQTMRFGHSFRRNQNLILTDSSQSKSYYYTCFGCVVKCVEKRTLRTHGFFANLLAIHTFCLFFLFFGNRNLMRAHSLSLEHAICFPHPLS